MPRLAPSLARPRSERLWGRLSGRMLARSSALPWARPSAWLSVRPSAWVSEAASGLLPARRRTRSSRSDRRPAHRRSTCLCPCPGRGLGAVRTGTGGDRYGCPDVVCAVLDLGYLEADLECALAVDRDVRHAGRRGIEGQLELKLRFEALAGGSHGLTRPTVSGIQRQLRARRGGRRCEWQCRSDQHDDHPDGGHPIPGPGRRRWRRGDVRWIGRPARAVPELRRHWHSSLGNPAGSRSSVALRPRLATGVLVLGGRRSEPLTGPTRMPPMDRCVTGPAETVAAALRYGNGESVPPPVAWTHRPPARRREVGGGPAWWWSVRVGYPRTGRGPGEGVPGGEC